MLDTYVLRRGDPWSVFVDIGDFLAENENPIVSIFSDYFIGTGHSVRAYRQDQSSQPCTWISSSQATCYRVYVLDPNLPSGKASDEQYIEFSTDGQWAYNPSDDSGDKTYPNNPYWGVTLNPLGNGVPLVGGTIIAMPYQIVDHQPGLPIEELPHLLAGYGLMYVGGSGSVSQVTDDAGRTMYTHPLLGASPKWSDLVLGRNSIPNTAPIPMSDQASGGTQVFASRSPNSVHRYDIGLAQGQTDGAAYTAMFSSGLASMAVTVPGTVGVPDQIAVSKIGSPRQEFRVQGA